MEQVFKVLSDFSRVRILNMLTKKNWCVSEMSAILGLSVTSVSRHLSKMRLAGMTDTQHEAQWVHNIIVDSFKDENKLLFEYIQSVAKRDEKLRNDNDKMKRYEKSGLTCKDICCSPENLDDLLRGAKGV